jgi:hypothetical protein
MRFNISTYANSIDEAEIDSIENLGRVAEDKDSRSSVFEGLEQVSSQERNFFAGMEVQD